jgi:RNA-directed DNA polymerase
MLANRAAEALDQRLNRIAKHEGWIYTRYADDLAFSRQADASRDLAMRVVRKTERALEAVGLVAHRQKTTIVPPGARKVLLGVLIDRDSPKLTKAFRNNVETHLYALNCPKVGAEKHRLNRGFSSMIGMRRHILGLIAFAHHVDRKYATKLYRDFNLVNWSK